MKKLLDYRQFYPDIGMKVLIEKSLISCTRQYIQMHDLLRELGKSIVREKSPKEPRKWNRLWSYKDLQKVMKVNKESENVEAIVIDQHPDEFLLSRLRVDALSKMNHLELLVLNNVNCFGTLNYISNELKYLYWSNFSWMSLPSTFHLDQLVELILPHSNIKKLWEGKKCLPNLKTLDLSHSRNLVGLPNFSEIPHLTKLILEGCIQIMQIDPSIDILKELDHLNLRNCKNLVLNLNILFGISSLGSLNVSGCSKLLNSKMLMEPRNTEHLEKADKNKNIIQLPTSSVYKLLMLPFHFFYPLEAEDSLGLLMSSFSFSAPCLFELDISFCGLLRIPDEIGNLRSLAKLKLGGNKFVTLPSTIKQLSNLQSFNLEHCKQLKYLPELPTITGKNGRYPMGLYVFDCPKLSDMEHCYSMVFPWMTQTLKVYLQPTVSPARMEIVTPGSQIPKWFNKQYSTRSVRMDPSAIIDDPNWIGVAICVLFVTHQDPMNLGEIYGHPYRGIEYGFNNVFHLSKYYLVVPIHFKNDLVTIGLDHLLTVFCCRQEFIHLLGRHPNTMHDLHSIEFETSIRSPKGLRVVVKNCGYRWVFQEDLQQLNSNMFFGENSSYRTRKLLTID
ncbi:disease resistance protein RPP2B-like [Vigna unguiculata]|uniref:disease resistance protein RPP2B-like n=1 Tax=Vigna unguiculata TaxID=3917 RepID=UPI0010171DD3|nr:disease resistance protein RPP2B-like [Vigna unguiculata]